MKLIEKTFGNFRTIRPKTMLAAVLLTLAYPVVKALISPPNRLLVFSDSLFITSMILMILGVLFSFARFGDFDITRYIFRRGTNAGAKPFSEFKKDRETERANSFNYPLFFGVSCFLLSLLTSCFC